jgi:hypothetical protein
MLLEKVNSSEPVGEAGSWFPFLYCEGIYFKILVTDQERGTSTVLVKVEPFMGGLTIAGGEKFSLYTVEGKWEGMESVKEKKSEEMTIRSVTGDMTILILTADRDTAFSPEKSGGPVMNWGNLVELYEDYCLSQGI